MGFTLNIARPTEISRPFFYYDASNPDQTYAGIQLCFKITLTSSTCNAGSEFTIVQELAKTLNFTYKMIPSPDGEWGRSLANGSWTGMVGLVVREVK